MPRFGYLDIKKLAITLGILFLVLVLVVVIAGILLNARGEQIFQFPLNVDQSELMRTVIVFAGIACVVLTLLCILYNKDK